GDDLRRLRALAVLEQSRTKEARERVEEMAGGYPAARVTVEAKITRDRLVGGEREAGREPIGVGRMLPGHGGNLLATGRHKGIMLESRLETGMDNSESAARSSRCQARESLMSIAPTKYVEIRRSSVRVHVKTRDEARMALKELKLKKKEYSLKKRTI